MTDHPITPPPELVQEWVAEIWHEGTPVQVAASDLHIANEAAQWGYEQRGEVNEAELQQARDQELEACRMEIIDGAGLFLIGETSDRVELADRLRAARRPKPLSLKEQALALIDECTDPEGDYLDDNALSIIRRALEGLPDA